MNFRGISQDNTFHKSLSQNKMIHPTNQNIADLTNFVQNNKMI